MRRSNPERSETMRQALMAAGRRLFVEKGYTGTATPDIAAAAGVTRGALYHHFEDKKALFAAIVSQEARQTGEAIEAASSAVSLNAREALIAGARGYLDAMTMAGRTRLLLLDGPAVLGAEWLHMLDAEHAQGSLKAGLAALLEACGKSAALLEALTDLLSAAFDRAALAIEAGESRKSYEAAIAAMIDGVCIR